MAWSKIELDNNNTIDYKQLSNFLLNHHSDTYSVHETIELLLRFDYYFMYPKIRITIDDLVNLGFDIDDVNHVMQMLIDDYNTTK
jgi:hypothetical protein